jgi:hypothetical protein
MNTNCLLNVILKKNTPFSNKTLIMLHSTSLNSDLALLCMNHCSELRLQYFNVLDFLVYLSFHSKANNSQKKKPMKRVLKSFLKLSSHRTLRKRPGVTDVWTFRSFIEKERRLPQKSEGQACGGGRDKD